MEIVTGKLYDDGVAEPKGSVFVHPAAPPEHEVQVIALVPQFAAVPHVGEQLVL